MSASATLGGTTTLIDPRPFHVRLGEMLKEHEVGQKVATGIAVTAGAAAGAGIGYLNYALAMSFYTAINVPSWFLTLATYSGYFSIGYLALFGAWLTYTWIHG